MSKCDQVRQQLADAGVSYVLVQFVDMHGSAKVKMVPLSQLSEAHESGAGFAGAAVWGLGQGPHSHDMLARIDLDTATPCPWLPNTARFAADLYVDEKPYAYCSRLTLKGALDRLRSAGYVFNVGMEPEHFLVTRTADGGIKPWNPDNVDTLAKPCYDFRSMAPAMGYLQELTSSLNALGWGVYQCDHEDANGQYEVNFNYSDALTTADRITFFKMCTSQLAKKYGAIATHMAKPFSKHTGSGLHAHFHLADVGSGDNVFIDKNDARGLGCSKLAYNFIGGVLKHAKALVAVTSPTVNCYKRLLLGSGLYSSSSGFTWTPAFISYGDNNRTQMIRTAGPGHFEDRTVSAGCNPYLALTAYIAAGLDGIQNKLDPGDPNLGDMYQKPMKEIEAAGIGVLPQSLLEAVTALKNDPVILESLGPIGAEFVELKTKEWETYSRQVTPWEIDQYLTFF